MLQRVAAETVGEIEDLAVAWPVLQPGLRLRRAPVFFTPLVTEVEIQPVKQQESHFGNEIRRIAGDNSFARQRDAAGAEVASCPMVAVITSLPEDTSSMRDVRPKLT